ncbi:MAG: hypothetical protein WB771_11010 [Solirubrobacterales bacterium]
MAGVALHPHGSASRRIRRAIALIAAAALLAALLIAARSASPDPAAAAKASATCPVLPAGLAPTGPGPSRFTMLIRINTQGNVDTYTKPDGGMGGRIRPQDIFVLNTRFTGSGTFPAMTGPVAASLAADLHATFPCNRIIALDGMSFDPNAPGYAFTGVGDPNVYALISDYERDDWNAGRATDPSRPPWKENYKKAFPLLRGWNFGFASTIAANAIGAGQRSGLAPQDVADWDYGRIAQNLDKQNWRLGGPHLGPQSVQTQDACADGGAAGFGVRAKLLRLQYHYRFFTKKVKVPGKKKKRKKTIRRKLKKKGRPDMSNLAMEISFTGSPEASASQSILSTSAAQAASCVHPGLKQGGGAFFFFASDDSMRLLFQQPVIDALRPATAAGSANSGGVGSPG